MSLITDIRAEINNDPSALGYSAIITGIGTENEKNIAIMNLLNIVNIPQNKTSLTGAQLWEATDATEFSALSDAAKTQWLALCGVTSLNPFGPAQAVVVGIFGSSNTVSTLALLRIQQVSRAQELKLQVIKVGHVEMARAV